MNSLEAAAPPKMGAPPKNDLFLSNMQILRLIAAMLVLFSHLIRESGSERFAGPLIMLNIAKLPWSVGVDIFFIISGFLMPYLCWHKFGSRCHVRKFLIRRFVRVIPLYWICTTSFLLIVLFARGSVHHANISLESILTSYLFLPLRSDFYPVLVLGWTIDYEIFFYCIFAIALLMPRREAVTAISVTFICVSLLNVSGIEMAPILRFWSNPIIMEFVFGIWICCLFKAGISFSLCQRSLLVLIGFGLLIVIGVAGFADTEARLSVLPRSLWAGMPCAMIVLGFILGPQANSRQWLVKVLVLGGDASYALYLTHMFSTRALTLFWHLFQINNEVVFIVAGLLVAPAVAVVVFLLLEAPLLNFLRNSAFRRSGALSKRSPLIGRSAS